MQFKARPYAEIAASRAARIAAGEKVIPKGECYFCAWKFQHKELYCSFSCAESYALERKELLGDV